MSTADPGADQVTMLPGSHGHFNYGFTEPGLWQITMTVSGTHVTAGPLAATETLNFLVIPEPSAAVMAGISLLALVSRRRRSTV